MIIENGSSTIADLKARLLTPPVLAVGDENIFYSADIAAMVEMVERIEAERRFLSGGWQAQNHSGQWWHEVKTGRELHNWAIIDKCDKERPIGDEPPFWLAYSEMPEEWKL